MNKKFSTLLTAGLLMVGSLCSSAWADVIPLSKAENGGKYKLISSHYFDSTTPWADQTGGPWYVVMNEDGTSKLSNAGDPTVWTVSVSSSASGTMTFSFTDPESNKKLTVPYATDKSKDVFDAEFAFDDKEKQAGLIWVEESVKYYIGYDGSTNLLSGSGLSTASPISSAFMLETLPDTGIDEGLNEIYNGFGFGLTAGEDVDGNLLNQQLFAVNVPAGGYELSTVGSNGAQLIIPEGTYFFTDRVWQDGLTDDDIKALKNGTKKMCDAINWPASTIIYVSPTATIETTNENRKAGQGFQLAEAQVSEFIYEKNASEYAVGDLPIANACFSVMEKGTSESYAIRLADFYYQENKTDAADKALKPAEDMNLGVLTVDDAKYLATTTKGGDWQYAFTISQDLVLDGIELLKNEKTAAVYTIRFVTGNQTQSDLFGKYLTLGTNNTSAQLDWIAKSAELTNEDFPIFQYTITAVEKIKKSDKKYTKITFTNRETNQYFDVQLYPVQISGVEGTYYSMAFPNDYKLSTVVPVSVKRNGYGTVVGDPVTINSDVIIELNPVTVDQYAGFAQIEDKEIRTIRYARDRYQTSNVWYAGVIEEGNVITPMDGDKGYFVDEAYDAAQFQINRVESTNSNPNPSMIARTYVYWNATTKSIDHVANGDVVAAYKYQLQYVSDGTAKDAYLSENTSANAGPVFVAKAADAKQYYIKENVDGSVSFIRVEGTFTNQMVAPYGAKEIFNVVPVDNYEYVNYAVLETVGRDNVYDYNVADMDLNVYLDDEIPVVSWMEAAHVTLRNNTLSNGNYISMNEKNEGILVNEAGEAYYLDMTDTDAVVPSFFISKGFGSDTERMYLYNPIDSIQYQVNMEFDPAYMIGKAKVKAIFKAGALNEDCDQMTLSDKGESRVVADEANADGDVWAGLKRFKFQLVKPSVDADAYYVRQIPEGLESNELRLPAGLDDKTTKYLASLNEVLYLTSEKAEAMEVAIEKTGAPVANESVEEAIEGVSVIAGNGTVTIQGAAGKQVIVSNILGKVVANTVLTSDNATISVPAGIVAVAVEGEEAVKAIVK